MTSRVLFSLDYSILFLLEFLWGCVGSCNKTWRMIFILYPLLSSNIQHNLVLTTYTTFSGFYAHLYSETHFLGAQVQASSQGLLDSCQLCELQMKMCIFHISEKSRLFSEASLVRSIKKSVVTIENCGYIFVSQIA